MRVLLNIWVLIAALAAPTFSQADQCRPDIPATSGDELLAKNLIQQAVWAYIEEGNGLRAADALKNLEAILKAAPTQISPLGGGVSASYLLEFHGGYKAVFKPQHADSLCSDCVSSREVAVYQLDQLLGFQLTPLTIQRQIKTPEGKTLKGSAMYFVPDAVPGHKADCERPDRLRLFDALIGNADRHQGNWLVTADGRVVAIDHNRAFRYTPEAKEATRWDTELEAISDLNKLGGEYLRYTQIPDAMVETLFKPLGLLAEAKSFNAHRSKINDLLKKLSSMP